jgi:hypothetical protein
MDSLVIHYYTAKSIIDLVSSKPGVYTERDLNEMIDKLSVRRGFDTETDLSYRRMILSNVKSDILYAL